jgi:hypothetical protein
VIRRAGDGSLKCAVDRAILLLAAVLVLACTLYPAGECRADASHAFHTYLRTTLREVEVPREPDASVRHTREEPVKPKSPIRAMLLSALVPGLGEMYVGGNRGYVTGGVLMGVDLLSIYKFYGLNRDGDDARDAYRDYADRYYDRARFEAYVIDTVAASNPNFSTYCDGKSGEYDPVKCDSLIDFYFPLAQDDDFYEQIDVVDRFVFGWVDWMHRPEYVNYWNQWEDPEGPIPPGVNAETARRLAYRSMREEANDLYSSADRYAWIMVIGRVVSMVDALILARAHNSQVAMLGSRMNLSFQVKSITDPAFRLGVKMRF